MSLACEISCFPPVRPRPGTCAACPLSKRCLPTVLDERETSLLEKITSRRRVDRDESLFRMEQPFTHLFVVRFGHFKTFRINPSGEQQVVGFQMTGEMMGMDAIGAQRHHCSAVALEDSEVCEIPFARLDALFGELPQLQRHFHRLMSDEISREQDVMLSLGSMRAEQRLAIFLLNLSGRYAARGYSADRFQLRMSRVEIGNYLGLTIESVSRVLMRFKQKGWLQVVRRELEILDRASIESLAGGFTAAEPLGSNTFALALHYDRISARPASRDEWA